MQIKEDNISSLHKGVAKLAPEFRNRSFVASGELFAFLACLSFQLIGNEDNYYR